MVKKNLLFEPIDDFTPQDPADFIQDFPPARFFRHRQSFIWWWWMFFFEENGVKKQIVAFWTTKTYKKNKVNGHTWEPGDELEGTKEEFSYQGMSTWWYWDGKEFLEEHPQMSNFKNICTEDSMDISSNDVTLKADRESFDLQFCRDPKLFDLHVTELGQNPPPVGYKRTFLAPKVFKKKMGFDALKIYSVPWKGKLTTNDDTREVEGTVYMQNITLNSPAFPWLWGVYHKKDGAYMTYFSSFVGKYMFRRSNVDKPRWDNRFKFMNKNLNYTPAGQETKRFKHVKYNVGRLENGMPFFESWGELGDEKLYIKVRSVGKTTYEFRRFKWFPNRFFYNELPGELVELKYTDAEGNEHVETGEDWNGNSEYSWGILLN